MQTISEDWRQIVVNSGELRQVEAFWCGKGLILVAQTPMTPFQ